MKKKILILLVPLVVVLIIRLTFFLLFNCSNESIQKECDEKSKIEYFLDYYRPVELERKIYYRYNFDDSKLYEDKDYLIYNIIKDFEYEEFHLSHEKASLSIDEVRLIYGSGVVLEQNFFLLDNLEQVCVSYISDGHIETYYSYRFYKIKKEDGLKILENLEKK